jgi:hypothetical protein
MADDNGYDDDGNFEMIVETEVVVPRMGADFVGITKQFKLDSASAENAQLLLDPMEVLVRRFPGEIRPDYTLSVTRVNAEVTRKGPHRAIWSLLIVPEEGRVEASVYRVPPATA